MNREIKFRGKRTDNGEWVYGYLVHDHIIRAEGIAVGTVNLSCDCEIQCNGYRVIPETIGQFVDTIPNTSMYVDNSKELYEGDLFRLRDEGDMIYEVVYRHGLFYGLSKDEWGAYTFPLYDGRHMEQIILIGNIHDTPDLVTAKKGKKKK